MQALLLGATVTDAAARAGVDRSTLYRWLNDDPKFHGELTRIKRERFESARAQIRSLSGFGQVELHVENVVICTALLADLSLPFGVLSLTVHATQFGHQRHGLFLQV